MPMSDEEFEAALNQLGLNTPPQASTMADANASYQPVGMPEPKQFDYLNSGKENEAYQSSQGNMPEFPEPTPVPQGMGKGPSQQSAPKEAPDQSDQQPPAPVTPPVGRPAPVAYNPQPSANPLDAPEINDAALKQAQSNADLKRLGTGIGEGFTRYAATAGGGKFDDAQFRQMNKDADSGVEDIKGRRDAITKKMLMANTMVETATKNLSLQRAQRLNDPASNESAAIRDMVTKYEPKLKDDPSFQQMSGQDVKDFMLHFLEAEGRIEATKASKAAVQNDKDRRFSEMQDKDLSKHQTEYTKYMNPDAAGFNNEVRKMIDLGVSADRAQAVLDQYKDPKSGKYSIPPERFGDLNLSVVNLLTNGKSSVHALQQITPHNVQMESSKIMQWFTGNPQGSDQTKWLKDYQSLLDRENNISKTYVKDYLDRQHEAAKHARKGDFYKEDPEFYDNVYKNNVQKYASKPSSEGTGQAGGKQGYDKDVLAYAEKHGISPDQAQSIKDQRTGQ